MANSWVSRLRSACTFCHVAGLGGLGHLAVLVEIEDLLAGRHVLAADVAFGIPLDLVALHELGLGDLADPTLALRVEDVVVLQEVDLGLVEARDRHRLEGQAVFLEVLGHDLLHGRGKLVSLRVQLDEAPGRGDGSQCRDELLHHELADAGLAHRLLTE